MMANEKMDVLEPSFNAVFLESNSSPSQDATKERKTQCTNGSADDNVDNEFKCLALILGMQAQSISRKNILKLALGEIQMQFAKMKQFETLYKIYLNKRDANLAKLESLSLDHKRSRNHDSGTILDSAALSSQSLKIWQRDKVAVGSDDMVKDNNNSVHACNNFRGGTKFGDSASAALSSEVARQSIELICLDSDSDDGSISSPKSPLDLSVRGGFHANNEPLPNSSQSIKVICLDSDSKAGGVSSLRSLQDCSASGIFDGKLKSSVNATQPIAEIAIANDFEFSGSSSGNTHQKSSVSGRFEYQLHPNRDASQQIKESCFDNSAVCDPSSVNGLSDSSTLRRIEDNVRLNLDACKSTEISPGKSTGISLDKSTGISPGKSTDISPGKSTDISPGKSTDISRGKSTDIFPGVPSCSSKKPVISDSLAKKTSTVSVETTSHFTFPSCIKLKPRFVCPSPIGPSSLEYLCQSKLQQDSSYVIINTLKHKIIIVAQNVQKNPKFKLPPIPVAAKSSSSLSHSKFVQKIKKGIAARSPSKKVCSVSATPFKSIVNIKKPETEIMNLGPSTSGIVMPRKESANVSRKVVNVQPIKTVASMQNTPGRSNVPSEKFEFINIQPSITCQTVPYKKSANPPKKGRKAALNVLQALNEHKTDFLKTQSTTSGFISDSNKVIGALSCGDPSATVSKAPERSVLRVNAAGSDMKTQPTTSDNIAFSRKVVTALSYNDASHTRTVPETPERSVLGLNAAECDTGTQLTTSSLITIPRKVVVALPDSVSSPTMLKAPGSVVRINAANSGMGTQLNNAGFFTIPRKVVGPFPHSESYPSTLKTPVSVSRGVAAESNVVVQPPPLKVVSALPYNEASRVVENSERGVLRVNSEYGMKTQPITTGLIMPCIKVPNILRNVVHTQLPSNVATIVPQTTPARVNQPIRKTAVRVPQIFWGKPVNVNPVPVDIQLTTPCFTMPQKDCINVVGNIPDDPSPNVTVTKVLQFQGKKIIMYNKPTMVQLKKLPSMKLIKVPDTAVNDCVVQSLNGRLMIVNRPNITCTQSSTSEQSPLDTPR